MHFPCREKLRSTFVLHRSRYQNWICCTSTKNVWLHALQMSGVGFVRLHRAYVLLLHAIGMFPDAQKVVSVLFVQQVPKFTLQL